MSANRDEWARVLALGVPRRRHTAYPVTPLRGPWIAPRALPIHRAGVRVLYRGPGIVHAADAKRPG